MRYINLRLSYGHFDEWITMTVFFVIENAEVDEKIPVLDG